MAESRRVFTDATHSSSRGCKNSIARLATGSRATMGGIYNTVNFHLYHYAGNNPVKYTDPDGRDIYNFMLLGVGAKVVAGGGITVGFAVDDKMNFASLININAGIGVEASADTPLTPSFSISKNVNITDLKHIGPCAVSFDKSASASAGVGIIYDFGSKEIVGGAILSIGGGVDQNLSIYLDFNKTKEYISSMPNKLKESFIKEIESNKSVIPKNIYDKLIELFKQGEKNNE